MNDFDIEIEKLRVQEEANLAARHDKNIATTNAGILTYGSILVKSLITLNSAGLFLFPALLSAMKANIGIYSDEFLIAAGSFIVGILSALICGLISYYNFLNSMQFFQYDFAKKNEELKHSYDDAIERLRMRFVRQEYNVTMEKESDRFSNNVEQTQIWAVVSGFVSVVSFIIGSLSLGAIILK